MKSVVVALLLAIAALPVAAADLMGPAEVIDGDTIRVNGVVVRLYGIDAPETGQECRDGHGWAYSCGNMASYALNQLLTAPVTCRDAGDGGWGRMLGRCSVQGFDLSRMLVRHGNALAYRQYSLEYVAVEEQARLEGRGVWQGAFQPPWYWRGTH